MNTIDVNPVQGTFQIPNAAKIDPKYAMWTAVTIEGKVHSGLLVDRSQNSVMLRTVKNEDITINRDDLEEFVQQTTSLMPDRILNELSDQQIADLIEYLTIHHSQ